MSTSLNKTHKVTVIIPCYNDGFYILKALKSINNQTVQPKEIIIIDDGSSNDTKNILKTIYQDNLKIIYQENKGVCNARNTAIKTSNTDYILNLDADDYFEPTFIEKSLNILDNEENVSVVGCFYKCFNDKEIDYNPVKPVGGDVRNFLSKNNGLGNSMYRKKSWEIVGGYDETFLNGYEDWDFWISILKDGSKMHIIQESLFNYRIKKTSRDQTAFKNHDFNLRKKIYFKHKDTYVKYIDSYVEQMLYANNICKSKVNKLEKSVNYKTGQFILKPLRYFKRLLSK